MNSVLLPSVKKLADLEKSKMESEYSRMSLGSEVALRPQPPSALRPGCSPKRTYRAVSRRPGSPSPSPSSPSSSCNAHCTHKKAVRISVRSPRVSSHSSVLNPMPSMEVSRSTPNAGSGLRSAGRALFPPLFHPRETQYQDISSLTESSQSARTNYPNSTHSTHNNSRVIYDTPKVRSRQIIESEYAIV